MERVLWISYYSSHEDKTCIYLGESQTVATDA